MLDTSNLSNFLKGITDAIRAKKGTTDTIQHKYIDEEIASITSGGGTNLDDVDVYVGDFYADDIVIENGALDVYERLLVV